MSRQLGLQLDPIMNPGGVQFPIKRGTWDFIELAWNTGISQSIISQIGNTYSNSTVYILYGCQLSSTGGNTTIQPGCIFFNGEYFISRNAITFTNPTGGNVVVVNLVSTSWQPTDAAGNQYADPVGFIGSSSANVHIDRTCSFASGASGSGTISGNTASDYSNLIQLPLYSSGSLVVSTSSGNGTVTGTIFYKKNIQDNTLRLFGNLVSATPSDFNDFPITTYYLMGNLPSGFYPKTIQQLFLGYNGFSSNDIPNYANTTYINQAQSAIDTLGRFYVRWIKPASAITTYQLDFSSIISLD